MLARSAARKGSKPPSRGCRGAAQAGNYIYLAGYGSSAANGSVIKVSTENDKYTVVASQDFSSVSEKSKFLHAETIAAYGGYIYVVASKVNSSYTYDNNILFKLNAGDLSIVKQSTLTTKNRDGQNAYILSGSSLYITADPYGTPCIEKINLSDMTSKTLISGSINSDGYAYNSLLLVGSTVYVSTSKYNWIAGCSDYKLYETTLANLEAGKLTSDDEISSSTNGLYGSAWLAYDTESHLVWAQQGALCSYDGEDFAFYSDSSTKNVPSKFICVESLGSNPNSGGSGSGGCNAGFGALLLLAAVPALTFTRKKK